MRNQIPVRICSSVKWIAISTLAFGSAVAAEAGGYFPVTLGWLLVGVGVLLFPAWALCKARSGVRPSSLVRMEWVVLAILGGVALAGLMGWVQRNQDWAVILETGERALGRVVAREVSAAGRITRYSIELEFRSSRGVVSPRVEVSAKTFSSLREGDTVSIAYIWDGEHIGLASQELTPPGLSVAHAAALVATMVGAAWLVLEGIKESAGGCRRVPMVGSRPVSDQDV